MYIYYALSNPYFVFFSVNSSPLVFTFNFLFSKFFNKSSKKWLKPVFFQIFRKISGKIFKLHHFYMKSIEISISKSFDSFNLKILRLESFYWRFSKYISATCSSRMIKWRSLLGWLEDRHHPTATKWPVLISSITTFRF